MNNRTFFCLTCRIREATDDGRPPIGWISVAVVIAESSSWRTLTAFSRLGLFCSTKCLVERAPLMAVEIGETTEVPA